MRISDASRRRFLAAGLAFPATGLASTQSAQNASKQGAKAASSAADKVAYRTLGKSGLKVTAVGFGCMITSDSTVISRAVDMGITYFDTARGYQSGNNERMVGSCLKGARHKVVLSSKSDARTPSDAVRHLETSLRELGTDYLDIWYMHARDKPENIPDELVKTWEDARKQGKIRHIGVSTHYPNVVADRVLQAGVFEVVLSTYNFMVGAQNDASYERMNKAGIGLVAMKVMAPAARVYGFPADQSNRIGRAGGGLAALKWALRSPYFSTTIPSMVDNDQLEENFRAMSEPFGTQDEKTLAGIRDQVRPLYCRMCRQCDGQCPNGVAVPETLRHLA